jgi:hypothetical protein
MAWSIRQADIHCSIPDSAGSRRIAILWLKCPNPIAWKAD